MELFSCNFNKEYIDDTCFCLLLKISQKCDIVLSLDKFIICFSTKFCTVPQILHIPNLTWSERFLHLLFSPSSEEISTALALGDDHADHHTTGAGAGARAGAEEGPLAQL